MTRYYVDDEEVSAEVAKAQVEKNSEALKNGNRSDWKKVYFVIV